MMLNKLLDDLARSIASEKAERVDRNTDSFIMKQHQCGSTPSCKKSPINYYERFLHDTIAVLRFPSRHSTCKCDNNNSSILDCSSKQLSTVKIVILRCGVLPMD